MWKSLVSQRPSCRLLMRNDRTQCFFSARERSFTRSNGKAIGTLSMCEIKSPNQGLTLLCLLLHSASLCSDDTIIDSRVDPDIYTAEQWVSVSL